MRAVIGTVLLCLLAAPTWAAEPPTDRESKLVISNELIALALQQPPAASKPGFDEWNGRLDRARDKRSKAQRLFWIGLGTNLGGAILAGAGGASCDYYYGDCSGGAALVWTGALISAGGGVTTIYSIFSWVSAAGDISDLDREGRIKGYLTLAPIPGGAQMAARFTF